MTLLVAAVLGTYSGYLIVASIGTLLVIPYVWFCLWRTGRMMRAAGIEPE